MLFALFIPSFMVLTYEFVLVTAHGVECEGEPHTDDRSGEEAHKHHLLLNLDLRRRSVNRKLC